MKPILAISAAFALFTAFSTASYAGASEDKNGVLHCSGKSSCQSLKTACENGHADYDQTSPTTGTCTVGAQSPLGLKAKVKQPPATLKLRSQQ